MVSRLKMIDIISLLPDALANKIAAGEVVQRPASAIKELLENAVDAQASQIMLTIKDGGSNLILVKDNGIGMSITDARICWERHATSKIKKVDDLFNIRSFGFRGEALASIAAVAKVEMKTRRKEDAIGTQITIADSKVLKQEPLQTNIGTQIAVYNLFYNLPARRNFLKSVSVETRHCVDEFIRVALAHPLIDFSLINNDQEVFRLLPSNLEQRFITLMDYKSNQTLLKVVENTDFISVNGFISTPTQAKKSRGEQFFFVNNRFIKDNYLNHAVFAAYEGLIEKDRFPSFVLNINIAPKHIDINVHPTKTEIKFDDDRAVYAFVRAVVRKSLSGLMANITPDEDAIAKMFINNDNKYPLPPKITLDKTFNPFGTAQNYSPKIHPNWEKLYEIAAPENKQEHLFLKLETQKNIKIEAVFVVSGIIFAKYAGKMHVINQHRAHLRILFEKYLFALQKHPVSSQSLLFPRTIILSPQDFELFITLQEDILKLGCEMHAFGNNKVIVNGLPPHLVKTNETDLLEGILDQYKLQKHHTDIAHYEKLALAMAQKTAIAQSHQLNDEELLQLVEDLFNCAYPTTDPKGEVIIYTYENEYWIQKFK